MENTDLISRAKALNAIKNELAYQEKHATPGEDIDTGIICGLGQAVEIVKGIEPSAEKTATWEPIPSMGDAVQCSNCKKYWTWTFNTYEINYCPSCGARMVK